MHYRKKISDICMNKIDNNNYTNQGQRLLTSSRDLPLDYITKNFGSHYLKNVHTHFIEFRNFLRL